ncbi:MAG: glycosyltransferase [Patescibacteria group bacterium]
MLSIILPAFNEEKNIGKTLDSILDFTKEKKLKTEIIVTNDGSKDKTGEILKKYQKNMKILLLLSTKKFRIWSCFKVRF